MFLKKKFKRKTSLNTSGLKVARLIFIRKTKETAFVGKKPLAIYIVLKQNVQFIKV